MKTTNIHVAHFAVFIATCALVGACKPADQSGESASSSPSTTGAQASPNAKPTVYTTFYPTTYFAQRIAGDNVDLVCPCPPDADPAFWMPDDATIAKYQAADLIILNGAAFEKWTATATLPESKVIETAAPFKDEWIVQQDAVTHSHGPGGAHTHSGIDGHTWLDPINAKAQAQQIADAFAKKWPDHAETFKKNMAALAADLDQLDAHYKNVKEKLGERTLLCSHPAYNYISRRYGWNHEVFHIEPSEEPSDDELAKIAKACAATTAAAMLWEAQPLPESATLMKERFKVANVVFSPCETLDEGEQKGGADFLTVMNANIDRLVAALSGE